MNDRAKYEIVVMGTLGDRWADWFPGMMIDHEEQGGNYVTRITGIVQDQSNLIGILQTLINLGLPLLLVKKQD